MTIFKQEFLAKVRRVIYDIRTFLDNPEETIDNITDAFTKNLSEFKKEYQQAPKNS